MKRFAYLLALGLFSFWLRQAGTIAESHKVLKPTKIRSEASVQKPSAVAAFRSPGKAPRGDGDKPEVNAEDPMAEAFAARALEQFRFIAELPGAHDLAWDIREALVDNPAAIDMSDLTEGPERVLRADYMERMIPDPVLREKWVALMEIVRLAMEESVDAPHFDRNFRVEG